jgi:hypothetical protein
VSPRVQLVRRMPLTLVAGSQLATMALCATLKSVTNHYNYPEWLGGVCRRVSRNGWQRSFPDEGCGSLCCISLFAEAGRRESVTFRQALMTELWALGTASAACSSFFSEVSLQDSAQFVGEACNRVYF